MTLNVSDALGRVEAMLAEDTAMPQHYRTLFELLVAIIKLFLAKVGIDSSNSSTPPSKDPKRERGSRKRAKSASPAVKRDMKEPI